ncbi:MAG TPA: TetR/AcrR family transcriptional regulator [Solirubrobacteraceae bacterium]|nr:TetR/AcrR family transcriptional regulator [Solirubrobacteraceae bacterium]
MSGENPEQAGAEPGEPSAAGLRRSEVAGAGAEPKGGPEREARRRVPAAERREELISAAVHEFAKGGLHGTAVDRIARRVGVAQPYVFSLFPNKRELFLAALERSFERIADTFRGAAASYREGRAPAECEDTLQAMGLAYKELLASDRDYLMLQHQSYAACDDEVVRARVRHRFAELVELARELSGADPERLDEFFRRGMALNVAAALGVEELSVQCPWVAAEREAAPVG